MIKKLAIIGFLGLFLVACAPTPGSQCDQYHPELEQQAFIKCCVETVCDGWVPGWENPTPFDGFDFEFMECLNDCFDRGASRL